MDIDYLEEKSTSIRHLSHSDTGRLYISVYKKAQSERHSGI